MLKIIYGILDTDEDFIYNGDAFFNDEREDEWLSNELVKQMILDIDKSEVLDNNLIKSPVLGLIPPEYLSGGVKTLISILYNPELIFNATGCGENCSKWLLKIADELDEDIIINLQYNMKFTEEPFHIKVMNTDTVITKDSDLALEALGLSDKYVNYYDGVISYEG